MKETKPYWYHNTAYSMEPYFVYLHFHNLLSRWGRGVREPGADLEIN